MKEQIMREAGVKLRTVFEQIVPKCRPGVVLRDIDTEVGSILKSMGARSALKMIGFPGNISIALNEEVIQGEPNDRKFSEGDLVSLDMTLYYKGFFVDKAVSFVLKPQHYIKNYLVNAVNSCLKTALMNLRPGVTNGQIGLVIDLQANMLKVNVCKELGGHTIGESHHMKPLIPNFDNGSKDILKLNDFVAIEPIVFYGHYCLDYKKVTIDSTTMCAHAEETVVITKGGAEVIT